MTGGLQVRPFRALSFDPARIRALAAVTSPPYDVVEADGVRALEDQDPHNVVRLILPRADDCGAEGRYARAAERLAQWRADGTIRTDAGPAVYVYELVDGDITVRGLVAAVRLSEAGEGVVLPHEDVMAPPVQDRLALLAATRANLEPVLLVHDGDAATSETVQACIDAAMASPPLMRATTSDGRSHRLWPVREHASMDTVRAAFGRRRALIADGHHRWAAGLEHARRERARSGEEEGPWAWTLALLVDSHRSPLALRAIHRVVSGLSVRTAVQLLGKELSAVPVAPGEAISAAVAGRWPTLPVRGDSPPSHPVFALVDADEAVVVMAATRPDVTSTLLHEDVLPHRWSVGENRVTYHHEVRDAVRAASAAQGTAVLLTPVGVEQVLSTAARGGRMPRKTTSFGPKPRSGLVMRAFDLDD